MKSDNKDVVERNTSTPTHDVLEYERDVVKENKYVWHINNEVEKNHSFPSPKNIRGVIVGNYGFGKTSLLNKAYPHCPFINPF